jgi:tRNA nucleotidyltransferase (CCA-adding enzyme)
MIPESVWLPNMRGFLTTIRKRIVVVGSVARTIRGPDFKLPKDIDVLCDLDSDKARIEIKDAIKRFDLHFESPFMACWTFRDYGWMVEILGIHHGPFYKTVRRRADLMIIGGVALWVAQPEDAPKEQAA